MSEENILGYELDNGDYVCEDCVDEDEFDEGLPIFEDDEFDEIPICYKCGKQFKVKDVNEEDD